MFWEYFPPGDDSTSPKTDLSSRRHRSSKNTDLSARLRRNKWSEWCRSSSSKLRQVPLYNIKVTVHISHLSARCAVIQYKARAAAYQQVLNWCARCCNVLKCYQLAVYISPLFTSWLSVMGDFLFAIYSNHQNNGSDEVYLVVADAMTLQMFSWR